MRAAGLIGLVLLTSCGSVPPRPARGPEPSLPPLLAAAEPLDRVAVLGIGASADPEPAIRELARHRLSFELDRESLEWFRGHGVSPDFQDYLRKRAALPRTSAPAARKTAPTGPGTLSQLHQPVDRVLVTTVTLPDGTVRTTELWPSGLAVRLDTFPPPAKAKAPEEKAEQAPEGASKVEIVPR